jgi:hypothetical protein
LNQDNIDAVAYYVKWREQKWKSIQIINCGLTENDL